MGLAAVIGPTASAVADEDLGASHGLRYVSDETPAASPGNETSVALATCPGKSVVVGSGNAVSGDATAGAIVYDRVTDGDDANNREDDESMARGLVFSGQPKTSTAFAICRKAGGSGLKRISDNGQIVGPQQDLTVRIDCPPHTSVTGGGVGSNGPGLVTRTRPFDDGDRGKEPDDGWLGTVQNVHLASNATLHLSVACAKSAAMKLSYRRASDETPPLGGVAHAVAACPAGTTLVGGGGAVEAPFPTSWLNTSAPLLDGGPPARSWELYAAADGDQRQATAFAVCKG